MSRPVLENVISGALGFESERPRILSKEDGERMGLALDEARAAHAADEVPIGAVIVGPAPEHRVLSRAHNTTREDCDPTAHAELSAIRLAARELGYQRLTGCTLYTTLEPCFMCAGAAIHARLERIVFGASDPKFGGTVSLGRVLDTPGLNHQVVHLGGVRAREARDLMQHFFRGRRADGAFRAGAECRATGED